MAVKKNNYISTEPIKTFVLPSSITGKKHYLYAHRRHDTGDPFYFGIGTMFRPKDYDRARCHRKRNRIWKNIVAKTSYAILIIAESDNKEEIIKLEKQYIALMGKRCNKSGCLANITDGGEGMFGHKVNWTPEMKAKIAVANSKRIIKDSTRQKLREALKKRGIINKRNG